MSIDTYIGIDPSFNSTGIVVLGDNGKGAVGLLDYAIISTGPDANKQRRALYIFDELMKMIKEAWSRNSIVKIEIEQPPYSNRGSACVDLFALYFYLSAKLQENNFKVEGVHPATIKKYATGNGRAKKEDLYYALPDYVRKRFDLHPDDFTKREIFDITDAYWIAKYGLDYK